MATVISGVGGRCAAGAAKELIKSFRPDLVISTGYAGGLSPEVRVGDIIVTGEVIHESGKRVISRSVDGLNPSPPVRRGPILTTNRFIPFSRDKKTLYAKFGASAVDMESFFLGEEAEKSNIPFLSIRAISDAVDQDLPQISHIVGGDGRADLKKIALYFLAHPNMIFPSIDALIDIRKATKALNLYLKEFFSSL